MSRTLEGIRLLTSQMQLEHRLSALSQLYLHSQLNTLLQWIGQRQLQYETGIMRFFGLDATYIRGFTVYTYLFMCASV